MDDSGENDQQHFVMQRRNLMWLGCGIICVKGADVQIKKLNFLGNEVLISDAKAIGTFLLVALVYLYLRYMQATKRLTEFRDLKQHQYHHQDVDCLRKGYSIVMPGQSEDAGIRDTMYLLDKKKIGIVFKSRHENEWHLAELTVNAKEKRMREGKSKIGYFRYYFIAAYILYIRARSQVDFLITEKILLEYYTPIIIAIVAFFELLGFGVSKVLLNEISLHLPTR